MLTWIVVTNSTKAFVYKISNTRLEKEGPILIKEFSHPESRLKETELLTGSLQGHHAATFAPHGSQGTFEHHADVHREEHVKFARELAQFLNQELNQHHYQKLVICAEPRFYGLLNNAFSEPVKASVEQHISKDYIPLPQNELDKIVKDIKLESVME